MGKLSRGLIGAVAGLGEGMAAVGTDQLKKNAELAKALREEAMQLRSFTHTESENKKTRELTASEGVASRTAKTEDLKKEIESKEKIASELRDLKSDLAAASEEGKRERLRNEIMIKEGQLVVAQQIADMKVSQAQGLIAIAQQNANTKEKQVDTGKTSSPTEQAKARAEAIEKAQVYLDGGDTKTAQTLLSPFGLTLQEETVPGEKNWVFPNEKDTKKYHIVDTGQTGSSVSPKAGVSSGAVPTTEAPPAGSSGKSELDSLLEMGKSVSGKTAARAETSTLQGTGGIIKSEKPLSIPQKLPASMEELDSMANSLPVEMDGIYKKSPSWERGRNISEGVSSITGQSQTTQNPSILRKGEDNLTKALRIATGKTDIYELNIIADKLKTIYKGKLSDAQLATLINEGKILGGNKTGV
jgi:hypothetical protein